MYLVCAAKASSRVGHPLSQMSCRGFDELGLFGEGIVRVAGMTVYFSSAEVKFCSELDGNNYGLSLCFSVGVQ